MHEGLPLLRRHPRLEDLVQCLTLEEAFRELEGEPLPARHTNPQILHLAADGFHELLCLYIQDGQLDSP